MPEATGQDPEAGTELASTAEDLKAVSRDRDSLDEGQRMSEVSAARDALQQKMLELTQERRSVLTDRHDEVSDGYMQKKRANSNRLKCTPLPRQLDEQLHESLSRVSERSQSQPKKRGVTRSSKFPKEMRV